MTWHPSRVSVAQWVEYLTGNQRIVDSILVGYSGFFLNIQFKELCFSDNRLVEEAQIMVHQLESFTLLKGQLDEVISLDKSLIKCCQFLFL